MMEREERSRKCGWKKENSYVIACKENKGWRES
jgi:hypothetical protein